MRLSLSIKITLAVIVAILLQTSLILFNTYTDQVRNEKQITQEDMRSKMARLQQSIEFLSAKKEQEQIQNELAFLGSNRHVNRVVLLDENDHVIASSHLADIGSDFEGDAFSVNPFVDVQQLFEKVRKSNSSLVEVDPDETEFVAVYAIDLGLRNSDNLFEKKKGVVYVSVDLSWVSSHVLNSLRGKTLPMLVLLGLIGLIFIVAINEHVIKRLSNVYTAASEFSSSGYKSRAEVLGNDEISDLAASFNQMADTVAVKSQEVIKQKEESLMIMDFMDNGVISIDEKGIIRSFNQSAEKLFGYSGEEVIGKNVSMLMPEPYSREHDSYMLSYLKTGHANVIGLGRDVTALNKSGNEFMMHLSVSEMPATDERDRMFIGTCLDITLQKQQEVQLRQSQKMDAMGKLTGGIAHDYNNMLGVILGYSELIKDEFAENNPRLLKFINEIYHAGNRGAKLTRKLLSFSRQKAAESSSIIINDLLNDNRHMLEKTLTVRVHIDFDLENDLWPVYVDPNDLEDALLNMCINSMHAMEGSGELKLITHNMHLNEDEASLFELDNGAGDYVCMEVCDTGSGISEELISKIFDPFFSTKDEKGNGLGLSQVYGFMQRSNGSISVDSKLGEGTCFKLYFPRYIAQVYSQQEQGISRIVASGSEKILVVDDESSLSELLNAILSAQGYEVSCAESAEAALKVLQDNHFDLLISDVLMPGMDGYQLAKCVSEQYPDIKLQLVSGFSDDLHKRNKDEELHAKLLHKPFDRQQLLHRIRELLDETA